MKLEELIQDQFEHVKQAFEDFEALKRVWERNQGKSADAFSDYREDIHESLPRVYSPFESDEHERTPYECDENDHDWDDVGIDKPWNKFTSIGENMADHGEVAPPRLMTDYSMIDAEDPIFHTGARLGIPDYVSIHSPYAGNLMLIRPIHGYGDRE